MNPYSGNRKNLERIIKMYLTYLDLYRFFNRGSVKGASPFSDFYWNQIYFSKHKMESKQPNK